MSPSFCITCFIASAPTQLRARYRKHVDRSIRSDARGWGVSHSSVKLLAALVTSVAIGLAGVTSGVGLACALNTCTGNEVAMLGSG